MKSTQAQIGARIQLHAGVTRRGALSDTLAEFHGPSLNNDCGRFWQPSVTPRSNTGRSVFQPRLLVSLPALGLPIAAIRGT